MKNDNYIKPGLYQHFKGGYYNVVGVVRSSETLEYKVLYQALYGDCGLWYRPVKMFKESVTRDGETFPRFKFISEKIPKELLDQVNLVKAN